AGLEQIPERLVEGLHAVLRGTGGDRFADGARLLGHQNAFPDVGGGYHDFDRGHSAFSVRTAHQALADDGTQHGRQLQADLFLLGRRENCNDTIDAFDRIQRVQGGENHVTRFGRVQGGPDGFQVAHFAHQNDIWILTERSAQGCRERRRIDFDLALVHVAFFVAVQKFDGVFDGDDVLGARRIDAVDHGGEGGRFARAGHSGDQHQTARHVANLLDYLRQEQFVKRADFGGNDAEHQSHIAALLKYVHTEASQAGDAVGHIDFRGLFEFLFLPCRHHAERHVQHVFGGDTRLIGQRHQIAINAQVRIVPHLQMQVGSAALHGDAEQVVDIHAGRTPVTVPIMNRTVPAYEMTEVTGPLAAEGLSGSQPPLTCLQKYGSC